MVAWRTSLDLLLPATLLFATLTYPATAATTYKVTPNGKWTSSSGYSSTSKIYSLPEALSIAEAGDTISLADGTYTDRVDSRRDGKSHSPIKIKGGEGAKIKAESPSVQIRHSWILLQGFTVDGKHNSANKKSSFVNKCVSVEGTGKSSSDPLKGFVMKDMIIKNCGTECVRLKNFVTNAEIKDNTIKYCGVYDFKFDKGGDNGEGVYIGTSNTQWPHGEDRSNGNRVSGNTIATYGSECVEVKEGCSGTTIEENKCSDQRQTLTGCFSIRGDDNTVRYNTAKNCEGVGVRLGGAKVGKHQYGKYNDVYDNKIDDAEMGFMRVTAMPQGKICENDCKGGSCDITADIGVGDIRETWDEDC